VFTYLSENTRASAVNQLSDVIAHDQLFGKAGLEACVDHDWARVGEW